MENETRNIFNQVLILQAVDSKDIFPLEILSVQEEPQVFWHQELPNKQYMQIILQQWFSTRLILHPTLHSREHLAMSGGISGYHNQRILMAFDG